MPTVQLPSLDATVAGTNANSYITLAFADAYFQPSMEWEEWESNEAAWRTRALVSATRTIEREFRGFGAWWNKYDLVDPEQALLFPRSGDYNDSGSLEIVDEVEEATCLLALHLLRLKAGALGPVNPAAMADSNVVQISTGMMSVSLNMPRWSEWPRDIRRLLQPFLHRGASGVMGRSVRKRRWHEGWIAQGS